MKQQKNKTMNEEEIKKLLAEVGDKHKATIKSEVDMAIKAISADPELGKRQAEAVKNAMEAAGIKADTIKGFQEAIEKQGEALRKLEANKPTDNVKSINQIIEEKSAEIVKIASGNGRDTVKIELPAASVNKTQVARAGVTGTTMAMRLLEVGQLPYLGMKMANLFRHVPVDPSSYGVIRFYDQSAITRAAASVAEGAAKPESAISWIERLLKIEKIGDSIPVTKEAFKDIYFVQGELDRLLNLNLALKEDALLWSGDGVSPNITGVYTTATALDVALATAYSGKVYAATVSLANIYDLIATMRVIIMNTKQSKYLPNVVVMNPADILAAKLTKDSFGRYVIPPYITVDGGNIDGCVVVESSQVTPNTLLVGDSRYGTIYDLEGITVEMGYINDQFVKGAMTIMAEKREALLIRNVDADAFYKCTDIGLAVQALTKL